MMRAGQAAGNILAALSGQYFFGRIESNNLNELK
jgi:hypothetical protein